MELHVVVKLTINFKFKLSLWCSWYTRSTLNQVSLIVSKCTWCFIGYLLCVVSSWVEIFSFHCQYQTTFMQRHSFIYITPTVTMGICLFFNLERVMFTPVAKHLLFRLFCHTSWLKDEAAEWQHPTTDFCCFILWIKLMYYLH